MNSLAQKFYTFKDYITLVDGILYYWDRVFVPNSEREKVLQDIHKGHQGESKCLRRANSLVWWPGMSVAIRQMVKQCSVCQEFRHVPREPLKVSPLPERAWWTLATDVYEFDSLNYLVIVDYYSRYIVARKLDNCEMSTIIKQLEDVFCMIGIPHSIVSDNAAYFKGEVFQKFLTRWDITHVTSAPRKSQSNGEAERAVQTVKQLMNKNINLQAALCSYRDTPLESGYSPAQLLFGRSLNSMGIGNWRVADENRFRKRDRQIKFRFERNYNERFAVRERSPLRLLQPVKIVDGVKKKPQMAVVVGTNGREVLLEKDGKILRRNRAHVRKVPEFKLHSASRETTDPDGTVVFSHQTEQVEPDSHLVDEQDHTQSQGAVAPSVPQVSVDTGQSVVAVAAKDAVASSKYGGAIAPSRIGSAVAPSQYVGAVAPSQSRGAVAPNQSRGAVAPNQSRGAVAPNQFRSAVAPNQLLGAVAPNTFSGAVAPSQSSGVVAPNQSSGAVAPTKSSDAVAFKMSSGVVAPNKSRNSQAKKQNKEGYTSRTGRTSKPPNRLNL